MHHILATFIANINRVSHIEDWNPQLIIGSIELVGHLVNGQCGVFRHHIARTVCPIHEMVVAVGLHCGESDRSAASGVRAVEGTLTVASSVSVGFGAGNERQQVVTRGNVDVADLFRTRRVVIMQG